MHERHYLDASRQLVDQILSRFADEENGGFYDTAADAEKLITRPKDVFDNATPGGNPVDAGSPLMIMTLGAKKGAEVEVTSDDEAVLGQIAEMVERDLDAE